MVAGAVPPGAASDALGTIVSDSEIHRLPSRNRDLYDFVALNPHVSTRFGVSVGGVNGRYNNFLIDGANAQGLHGRAPAGAGGGGKLISIEAVKEYQVLVAPYDVSLGDFAGGLVSAVTRSGTNTFHGSMFVTYRNESLARDVALLRSSPYDQTQFGGWVGGPILRNRIQFFVAAEVQRLYSPIVGPFHGQPASRDPRSPRGGR